MEIIDECEEVYFDDRSLIKYETEFVVSGESTMIECDMDMYNQLLGIIEEYVEDKSKNGINQGDDAWLADKMFTFGGSTRAVLTGKNKYQSLGKFLAERCGITKSQMGIACWHGTLFEEIMKRVSEWDYCCKIIGENLYIKGEQRVTYSPDGISVVVFSDNDVVYNEGANDVIDDFIECTDGDSGAHHTVYTPHITLWEFKAPYRRIPNGNVPDCYIDQPLLGMHVIPMCTKSIFAEGVIRPCKWDDLGYNTRFNTDAYFGGSGYPIAFSYLGLTLLATDNKRYPAADVAATRQMLLNRGECDWGGLPRKEYEDFMRAFDMGMIGVYYAPIKYLRAPKQQLVAVHTPAESSPAVLKNELDADLAIFKELCEIYQLFGCEDKYIGFMPWKLLRIDYHHINPIPNYLKKEDYDYMEKLYNIITTVRACAPEDRKKKLKELCK